MKTDLELLLREYYDLFRGSEWHFVVLFADDLLYYISKIDYTADEKIYYMKIKEYTKKLYDRQIEVYDATYIDIDKRNPFEQFILYYRHILTYFPTVEVCTFTRNLINNVTPLIKTVNNLNYLKFLQTRNDEFLKCAILRSDE